MKSIIIIAVIVLVIGGLIFLSPKSTAKNSAPGLTMQTVKSDVGAGGKLLDVRTPAEYASGHIDGAINLSLQSIQAGTLPSVAKTKPVYVYCRSGSRSAQAAKNLKSAGFSNVIDLGGISRVQAIGGVIKK